MPKKLTRRLTCIAHRGAHDKNAPENTLLAISQALALGVDAIEIDVWNIGGDLLVTHDRHMGDGLITAQTSSALRAIKLPGNHQIPTLQEVLALVNGQVTLNIELKGHNCADATIAALNTFIANANGFDPYIISSFDHHQLFAIKHKLPDIKLGVLTANIPLDYAACCDVLQAYSFHPSIDCISQALVDDAHKRGLTIWVYTVNTVDDMHRMSDMGVDGIFTDCPQTLLNINPDMVT